jgi:hypothetical protein
MTASFEATHRGLDGTRFVFRGPVDLTHPVTSTARVVVGAVVREFNGLQPWVAAAMAEHSGVHLDEEFSFQGGTLRVGGAAHKSPDTGSVDRLTLAVWSGRQHALTAHMYDAATSADVLRLLNAVRIFEHDDGLVITPRTEAKAAFYQPVRNAKLIPGLGSVDARIRESRTLRSLPPWSGARVPGGELFRDTMTNGAPFLVLATSTAVVTIVPRDVDPLEDAVHLLEGFTVETVE